MSSDAAAQPLAPNRLTPMRFVLTFGLISALGDFVYEGARSITGPFLGALGVSAPPSESSPVLASFSVTDPASCPVTSATAPADTGR